ncbi:MAG: AraC family transcriptional regulator [Rhizobiaceae bacterium]
MVPLNRYTLFCSDDLDEARELVARKFCQHRLNTVAAAGRFHARHNCVAGALLAINYMHYGATVLIEPGALEHFYLIQLPIAGRAEIRNGGVEVLSDAMTATILNPDRDTSMVWRAGCEQLLIYVDRLNFNAFAEAFLGRRIGAPIVFEPAIDLSRAEMARWRQHVLALFASADEGRLFQDRETFNQTLVEEAVLAGLLTWQPSNVSAFVEALAQGAVPAPVKKAQRYITDHAGQSIALCDIAGAAGVPIRTLQHGFHTTLGCSPMEALRGERLTRVRCELASGHCDGTVTDIAAKWGFLHFGRFSGYYRRSFGELPSATLARARRERGHA